MRDTNWKLLAVSTVTVVEFIKALRHRHNLGRRRGIDHRTGIEFILLDFIFKIASNVLKSYLN